MVVVGHVFAAAHVVAAGAAAPSWLVALVAAPAKGVVSLGPLLLASCARQP